MDAKYTLAEVAAFLDGSGTLDGVAFGEPHPTEPGMYWWRKHLRAALSAALAAAPRAREQPFRDPPEATDFDEWYASAHWGNEDFRDGCRRAWKAALAAAWVPVAERMPPDNVVVLVYSPDFGRETAAHDERMGWMLPSECGDPANVVTHWMPLPAPPKEAGEP